MTWYQAFILGIIQGLTEFLPVSSSGHLVIIPYLLGWQIPERSNFIFDVLVQVATLGAVVVYFWKDIIHIGREFLLGLLTKRPFYSSESRIGWYIIIATIPAGIFGLLFKDFFESLFSRPIAAGTFLLVTAELLISAEFIGNRLRKLEEMTWVDALWVGFFQVIAILPGVSRSGATITGGMLRNLERPSAARFSFLISIPIMLAAGLLASIDLLKNPQWTESLGIFLPGFLSAAVIGYLSIKWFLGYLGQRRLYVFAIYCLFMGILTIITSILRK